jgi:decaprenyl-phosphate phosphoribosyltransferase
MTVIKSFLHLQPSSPKIRPMHNTAAHQNLQRSFAGLVRLLRPKQWIKNGFVLAPLLFTGLFLDVSALKQALIAALLFCIASSASYIVNDIQDVERDRLHPEKSKSRPLASGAVTVPRAVALLLVLYSILIVGWWFEPKVILVIVGYLVLNIAYSFVLKHQPVIDIFSIAIGFVLRVLAGAVALEVPVSGWMFTTTLSLALYLAAVKRGQELTQRGSDSRQVLKKYSKALVDRYAEMSATCAVVFYSMFVMASKYELVATVPLVLFGLYRYWYVVDVLEGGESPTEALLSDWPLLITVLLWIGACAWALWPH